MGVEIERDAAKRGAPNRVPPTPKRSFRDTIVAASIGVLLMLGVTGELSGARTPDHALLPVHREMADNVGAYGDCALVDWMIGRPEMSTTIRDRAFRDRLEAARDRLGCPS